MIKDLIKRWVLSLSKNPGFKMATTTLTSEQKSYTWIIPNFVGVCNSKEVLERQQFELEMCAGAVPLKWRFALSSNHEEEEGEDYVEMHFSPQNLPPGLNLAHARIQCLIPDKEDGVSLFFHDENVVDIEQSFDSEFGTHKVRKLFPQILTETPFLSADGSLEIRLTVSVFYHCGVQDAGLAAAETIFDSLFIANHRAKLNGLRSDPLPNSGLSSTACKIMSKDGHEFSADRAILHARSPVFKAMFQSGMREGQEGGVLEVKDIDGEPLKVLLQFIHTGELTKNWKEEGVIEGVVYGAHKYILEDLMQFLDKVMALLCTTENCGKLAGLAKAFGMKTAEELLLKYFNQHISKSLDDVLRFAEETANVAMLIAPPPPECLEGTGEQPTAKKSRLNSVKVS